MKICIVSDSHDNRKLLDVAVGAKPTYVIGDLQSMEFEICDLPVGENMA